MTEAMDILAFAPHPDDAELGCAGALILASDSGQRTAVVDLTAGECSTKGDSEQRNRERERASEIMGLTQRFTLGLPDTGLVSSRDQLTAVVHVIRQTRARILLVPFCHDRHPDHAAASRLVQEAGFLSGVRQFGQGAPHRPERTYFYMLHYLNQVFEPSFVIDISTVWARKLAAIEAYASQFHVVENEHPATALGTPSFLEFNRTKAAWFGAMIGAAFGEPYYAAGPVPQRAVPGLGFPSPRPGEMPFSIY